MENNLLLKNRYSQTARRVWGFLLIASALLILAGAIYVPFIFESQTMRYQFGLSGTLLRCAHVMGTAAGTLICLQLILISRVKFLDRIFSINRLLIQHRINAALILVLVIFHFLLILKTLGSETLALELRQWPEFTGLLLLVMLAAVAITGLFRRYLGISYSFWFFMHRIFTPVAILLLCVHVYFVSETFNYGGALILIISFFIFCFLFYLVNRVIRLSVFNYAYRVESVNMAGSGICTVELMPEKGQGVINVPGQFAFIRFKTNNISGEEHPFTISSSPTRPPLLQFTIRSSGDWTEKIINLEQGDRAFISGPYGILGHLDPESPGEMIMVAGGIGITPMLSMLRYLSDVKSDRKITLIWSARTKKEIVYPDEFGNIQKNLSGLTVKYLFTREEGGEGSGGRLDMDNLKALTSGCSKNSVILVCGPPAMMSQVKKTLISIGFPRKSVVIEKFSL